MIPGALGNLGELLEGRLAERAEDSIREVGDGTALGAKLHLNSSGRQHSSINISMAYPLTV